MTKEVFIPNEEFDLGDTRERVGVVYRYALEQEIYRQLGVDAIGYIVLDEDDETETYRITIPLLENDDDEK